MRSIWRTIDRGTLRDIGLVCAANTVVGISFGALAVSAGLDVWVPVVMSLVIYAGGAQFAALGVIMGGGSAVAAVLAGLVLNARHVPFGFAVSDVLAGPWWRRLAGSHLMVDESVAFTLRHSEPRLRRAAFWVCGVCLFLVWNVAVWGGALAGQAIGDMRTLGLDAAFPAVLLALVLPSLADRNVRRAALLGALVAVAATPFLPAGLPVLLALVGLVLARRPTVRPARDPAEGAR